VVWVLKITGCYNVVWVLKITGCYNVVRVLKIILFNCVYSLMQWVFRDDVT